MFSIVIAPENVFGIETMVIIARGNPFREDYGIIYG
jgi:hypothetical protein